MAELKKLLWLVWVFAWRLYEHIRNFGIKGLFENLK